MPTAFDVRALASTVRVELDDSLSSDEQQAIAAQWSDLIVDDGDAPHRTISAGVSGMLAEDGAPTVVAPSADILADLIATEITHQGITELRGQALMLHAAAASLDDGRVVGFVGPSGRGKTTASRALGTVFGYVTDETLAVRPDGAVVPYPKPLSLGERPGHKRTEGATALGLKPAAEAPLRLAAIVLLDRQADVAEPILVHVPLTEVLAELVPQTSFLPELENPLRTLAELVISTGGVRRAVYAEADTLPGLVEQILANPSDDGDPRLTEVATPERDCDCFKHLLPEQYPDAEQPRGDGPAGTFRRATHRDALMVDDQLLVLVPGTVTVLDGIGPIVWLAANDSTEAEITAAAVRQLPEPPEGVDPSMVVSAAIRDLVEAGLLVAF
ncbi:hypothetical protein [Agromyces sp. NPDC055661]|jgi:hypothetical protein